MTSLAPERPTGTLCGEMLTQGIVAYRCGLEQGHHMVPEDDPEPHYAVEVGRSVRAWQAWRQRQMEREENPVFQVLGGVSCPQCGSGLTLSEDGTSAWCIKSQRRECDAQPIPVAQSREVQKDETFPADDTGSDTLGVAEALRLAVPRQRPGADAQWFDISDLDVLNAVRSDSRVGRRLVDEMGNAGCPRTVVHDHHFWGLRGDDVVYQCKGDLSDAPGPDARAALEPTKQREGDQPLPEGGFVCVQDRIIAEMEESKRIGMERYGSVLRTFNGRKGMQDVLEEVRDLHVYVMQIVSEAEATREQLEVVVGNRIRPILDGFPGLGSGVIDGLAGLAVDAVMGWVTGQPSQVPDSPSTG